jgi:hypothetical protein
MVAESPQAPGEDVHVRAYPADVKAKAKALYLVKCLQPRDIAAKLDVPIRAVYDWVDRSGWAQIRRDKLAEVSGKIDGAMRQTDAFMEVVAAESEEIALAGFERARGAVQSESEFAAKDFASWTSGVKNLVGMYRTAKGLDASQAGPQITFNAFYSPTAPKAAQAESIDVTTTPAE